MNESWGNMGGTHGKGTLGMVAVFAMVLRFRKHNKVDHRTEIGQIYP
jgi:hypothetical protein